MAYEERGRWDEAISAHKQAISLAGDDAGLWLRLAASYTGRHRRRYFFGAREQLSENHRRGLGAALDAFEEALRLDPTNPETWTHLALTYRELDRIEEQVAAYRRAVELRPDYVHIWHDLTTVYYNKRQFDEVARVCQEAVKKIPGDAHSWFDLGFANEELKRLDEAAAAYAKAWALRPDFPGPWVHLGVVYAKLGRVEEAVTVYREAMESKAKARQQFDSLARHSLEGSEGGQAVLRRLETLYPKFLLARQRKS